MGRIMVDLLRYHRADDSKLVGMPCDVWEQAGNLYTTLAMPGEFGKWTTREERCVLQLCELLTVCE